MIPLAQASAGESLLNWADLGYLIAAICFIMALKLMNSPVTARKGNWISVVGMLFAIGVTFIYPMESGAHTGEPISTSMPALNLSLMLGAVAVGTIFSVVLARKIAMTSMPQLVAALNGLGGGSVALVSLYEFMDSAHKGQVPAPVQAISTVLSVIIGTISFSGSVIAFGKLQELLPGRPLTFPGQKALNGVLAAVIVGLALAILVFGQGLSIPLFALLIVASFVLGISGVTPIGGADMPVVISLLNSFTGVSAGLAGFVLMNTALLIGGGLVGASGLILTLLMCTAMNRTLANVLFAGVGAPIAGGGPSAFAGKQPKSYAPEDAAILLANAEHVVIVPGYGMAVAQAQHQVKEMATKLQSMGIDVKYAVHPVAGRMPGHMNVLLAEADVPYEQLYELEQINPLFPETDVVLVLGANDVVNPAARYDKSSPIYGMPILDVDKAKTVLVSKRSMGVGFAGVDNELFVYDNTAMIFGNAKSTVQKITQALDNY
ncbi:MAG TPA: NAD(P)(+) transhydrogenase (Re/Si-specific) subunit beta [Fimbriimonadaceae bacterium]|nr:NAD(P)(+) transhydrogenase (Re/Si-specific) subunit beta [Fimbriimonadaceae bacterium]